MNIIFFTYDYPYPTNSGGKTRAYNLLKFAKGKNTITLFSFTREYITEASLDALKNIGIKKILTYPRKKIIDFSHLRILSSKKHSIFYSLYYDKKIQQELISYIRENDIHLVHYESFYTGFYLSDAIRKLGVKQIYGSENIEYRLYKAYMDNHVSSFMRFPYNREVKKIQNEEMLLYKNADGCLGVTDAEVNSIRSENKRTYKIPNGVDLEYFTFTPKEKKKKRTILFVGSFSYFPNISAIRFFYHDVFRKLQDENLQLLVIGKNFKKIGLPSDERIVHKEFVDDIHAIYAKADIFVSPVSIGGGTNFKILEAMASGTPVVAMRDTGTSIGAKENEEILIAEKDTFLDEVRALLENTKLQETLPQKARVFIEKNYSWNSIGRNLNNTWEDILRA